MSKHTTKAGKTAFDQLHLMFTADMPGMRLKFADNKPGLRCLIAARKSNRVTDKDRVQIKSIGIKTQDLRAREWIERNGHIFVDIAADVKSGRVAPWDRPNLKMWVTDPAFMAQYDAIVVYSNDRLSRGCWEDEIVIRLWAMRYGKRLIVVDGPQWPPRDTGDEWSWEANAKQAAKEWDLMQERVSRAQADLRSTGALIGRAPWGYEIAGDKYCKRLVVSEDGRTYVPEVFQRIIDGESLQTVANWLAEETGRPFWSGVIGKMIKCPTYKGTRCIYNPETHRYEDEVVSRNESLVDAVTWRLANEALAGRPKRGPQKAENRAPLVTALFCANCADSPMYRLMGGRQTSRTHYYRCFGRGANRKSCGSNIRTDWLEPHVDRIIATSFNRPIMAHAIVRGNEAEIAARLEEIKDEMKRLVAADKDEGPEYAALVAERAELRHAEVIGDTVKFTDTGRRYSAEYANVPVSERGPWLHKNGFRIIASRQRVTVSHGDYIAEETFDDE
jgi:DNA invertase Pin-like site-specific DNA recombinase